MLVYGLVLIQVRLGAVEELTEDNRKELIEKEKEVLKN
jgi:hypothetical protein